MVKNSIYPISARPPELASTYLNINITQKGDQNKYKKKLRYKYLPQKEVDNISLGRNQNYTVKSCI